MVVQEDLDVVVEEEEDWCRRREDRRARLLYSFLHLFFQNKPHFYHSLVSQFILNLHLGG